VLKTAFAITLLNLGVAFAFSQQAPATASAAASPAVTTGVSAAAQLTPKEINHLLALKQDWAKLNRYRAEDAALAPPAPGVKRVVFLGDSITDAWGRKHGKFFPGKPYINRGISGQTTPQMLVRFQQDVLALHPAVVVILAGTNDFAQNTGPEPMSAIEDNFRSMVTLAKAAHVRVVLSSTLPATRFNWHPGINASAQIKELNRWMAQFCKEQKITFLNYYPALVNSQGGMRPELTTDGSVHPNDAGYAIMEPLAERAIAEALAKPAP
jgi:lysophospholipase L1-like esterase